MSASGLASHMLRFLFPRHRATATIPDNSPLRFSVNQAIARGQLPDLLCLMIETILEFAEDHTTATPTTGSTCATTCESGGLRGVTLLAPSGQCPSCDRRRALLNAAKKRHREERRGG